jgi:histidine triad (HIT) family protein
VVAQDDDIRDQCIFCRIADGRAPAEVVHQDDAVVAFKDVNPQAPLHVLVIPRAHVADLAGLADLPSEYAGDIIKGVARVAETIGNPSGYRVATNTGPNAGQTVMHLHFHLVSGRRFDWPPG